MAINPNETPQPPFDDPVGRQIDQIEGAPITPTAKVVRVPVYKIDPVSKIPVSRHEGPVWEGRKNSGHRIIKDLVEQWSEAESYYCNAQMNHRKVTGGDTQGNRNFATNRREMYSHTENMVYATVNAIIPYIYAKNPSVEVTMTSEGDEEWGEGAKHLLNNLASMKFAPGLSLKPKVRKCIMRTEITNESWVMIGWTKKEDSADNAREEIMKIGAALVEAKGQKEIEQLEGKLMAIEEASDLLDPEGPFVKTLRGDQVLIDPASVEDDHSDANWMMVQMMFPTNYLNARYRKEQKDGSFASEYAPTHVVDGNSDLAGADFIQSQIDNFKIIEAGKDDPGNYGYRDKETYDRNKYTKVWYCFDKVKRRFYLYSDKEFTWPIWVFDDPYHLPHFFPLHKLQYHTDPRSNRTKGEVSNYLDQQDQINLIVDEKARAIKLVRDNLIYDSTVWSAQEIENMLNNANKKAKGVKVPEGHKVSDSLTTPPLPTLQHQFLWDSQPAMQAINKISGVGDALRGEQFKTNTTNEAIKEYSSISGTRLDEKRDAIEDFIGDIMYSVLFLSLQFMKQETVAQIVGKDYQEFVASWKNMVPEEIRSTVRLSVEGGSSQKPTSSAKKAEALQIGQILGQFVNAAPQVGLIMLKVFERSFDGIVMTNQDWEMVQQSITTQLQGGQQQGPPGGGDPQAEQLVQAAVQRGVPEQAARQMVAQKLSGGNKPATPAPNNQQVH